LTPDDKRAILDYTGPGYRVLNSALRSGAMTQSLQDRIRGVRKALTKKQVRVYSGLVYRGCNELPQSVRESLLAGATYSDKGFLSTSVEKNKAFASQDGCFLFEIRSKTGVDVSSYSAHKDEAGVLFAPSALFRILAIKRGVETTSTKGITLIQMEEIA